jgi:uncharacterized membrane protein
MRMTGLGRLLFALSFAIFGALIIVTHDLALVWPPATKAMAWHDTLAALSGALLMASAVALLVRRAAAGGSLVLAGLLLLRVLALQVPGVIAHPLAEAAWYSVSEDLIQVAGAWTIFSFLPNSEGALAEFGNVRAGQVLFALALPAIGLSHIIYLDQTAPLIPPWLPFHVPLAYLTGAAHIAAGVGILFGVLPRLAATLEATMVSLFTLLVWVPALVTAPTSRSDWAEFCISTAIAGSAWAVAESFRSRSWRLQRGGQTA